MDGQHGVLFGQTKPSNNGFGGGRPFGNGFEGSGVVQYNSSAGGHRDEKPIWKPISEFDRLRSWKGLPATASRTRFTYAPAFPAGSDSWSGRATANGYVLKRLSPAVSDARYTPAFPEASGTLQEPADTLRDLLSDTTSLQAAAERFASSVRVIEDAKRHLWKLFFDTVACFPVQHSILVKFYFALQDLASDSGGEIQPVASELIGAFEMYWRERCDMLWASWQKDRVGWINFNAFSAKLVAAGLNMPLIFGFVTIRNTIETRGLEEAFRRRTVDKKKYVRKRDRYTLKGEEDDSALICAAAQWILHAGQVIFRAEHCMLPRSWRGTLAQKTDLWRGGPGFSHQRWIFWRQRLWKMAKREEVIRVVKVVAVKAVAEMIRIERRNAVPGPLRGGVSPGVDVKDFGVDVGPSTD